MKTKLLLFLFAFVYVNTQAQCTGNVNIPDVNFKAALLENTVLNTNNDGEISCEEASNYSGSIISTGSDANESEKITDLTGIEAFVNITKLNVSTNRLTSLDISKNTKLQELICSNNDLTSLDLSNISEFNFFIGLFCSGNNLNRLNMGDLTSQTTLSLFSFFPPTNYEQNANLTCIQVNDLDNITNWENIVGDANFSTDCDYCEGNITIEDPIFKQVLVDDLTINTDEDNEISCAEAIAYEGAIGVANKGITSLKGLEAFINITHLECQDNELTTLDVSANRRLTYLDCSDNQLIEVDVSVNKLLTTIVCNGNNLRSLNVANGNNESLSVFSASNNPILSCIQIDENIEIPSSGWFKNDAAQYSTDCSDAIVFVHIPDDNFKQFLVNKDTINTDGDTEISYTEAEAYTGELIPSSIEIADLTGVEAFINITSLNCSFNNLTALDVSKNTLLTALHCFANDLTRLDVTNNTALTDLNCSFNELEALDVSKNTFLTSLDTSVNKFEVLDVSNNTLLTALKVFATPLTSLNIANGNNLNLEVFSAIQNTTLTCIQVDDLNTIGAAWEKEDIAEYSTACDATASTTDEVFSNNISVFPNPVNTTLTISVEDTIEKVAIYNTQGQNILESNHNEINVSALSAGLYILQIATTTGKVGVKRFIKK